MKPTQEKGKEKEIHKKVRKEFEIPYREYYYECFEGSYVYEIVNYVFDKQQKEIKELKAEHTRTIMLWGASDNKNIAKFIKKYSKLEKQTQALKKKIDDLKKDKDDEIKRLKNSVMDLTRHLDLGKGVFQENKALKKKIEELKLFDGSFDNILKEANKIYQENKKDKGESWRNISLSFLIDKLEEEYNEYVRSGNHKELLDIINVALMLAERIVELNSKQLNKPEQQRRQRK